jgi:hypothetical protein
VNLQDNSFMLFPREHLVAALHQRGVCYLAPSPYGDEPHFTDDELILGLAASRDGRLRFALAGLMLVDPGIAARAAHMLEHRDVRARHGGKSLEGIPETVWADVQQHYLAAMYLQRMWRTRLRLALGETEWISEAFTTENNLPPADDLHGEHGLRVLTDKSVFNDWSSYQQVIDMICDQPCANLNHAPAY